MPIKSKAFVTIDDVRRLRDCLFVFGDNDQRKGKGGQAHACRGEPNTVGVRMKSTPADHPSAAWTDAEFEANAAKIDEDVAIIGKALEAGRTVVFPKAGLSVGERCRLEDHAPRTAAHLCRRLGELKGIGGTG